MTRHWKTLEQRILLDRWWMTLREDRVELPEGTVISEFHVIEYPDWALTIPVTRADRIVMVEQYRYGIDEVCLEFPAGAVFDKEDPRQAAARELREETGFAADEWIEIGNCAPEPSKHTNFAHLFLARGTHEVGEPETDETEQITVRQMDPDALIRQAQQGELRHGIHLTALFWALQQELL